MPPVQQRRMRQTAGERESLLRLPADRSDPSSIRCCGDSQRGPRLAASVVRGWLVRGLGLDSVSAGARSCAAPSRPSAPEYYY
jgi:hypothetical protein